VWPIGYRNMARVPVIKAPLYTPSLEEVANGNHLFIKQEYRHCDKKLAHLLFDFYVIPLQMLSTQVMVDEC